ncbi:MAG: hypothetical protein VB064_03100 [Oscillospiraceae bacterium]|nr:hypothetical protein [Oscillospiraceae bacterium]
MGKKAYIGTNSVARKIKKGYIGVGGIARKIKKAYIGIGGVAKQFLSSYGTPSYYGTAPDMSQAMETIGSSYNDEYVLFIGGSNGNSAGSATAVDAYNKSLVRSSPANAPYNSPNYSVGAKAGSYAVVFGGANSTSGKLAFAYSSSLALTSGLATTSYHNYGGAGTLGEYAIGAGGAVSTTNSSAGTASVEAMGSSLAVTALADLSSVKKNCKTGINEKYLIFACGTSYNSSNGSTVYYDTVDAYNLSLVKTVAPVSTFTDYYYYAGVGSSGEYAVIFKTAMTSGTNIEYNAYNTNLVRTSGYISSGTRSYFGVTNVNGCTFVGGGLPNVGSEYVGATDVWSLNDSLVSTLMSTGLVRGAYNMGVGSIGDYALFASGRYGYSSSNEGYRPYVTVYTAT